MGREHSPVTRRRGRLWACPGLGRHGWGSRPRAGRGCVPRDSSSTMAAPARAGCPWHLRRSPSAPWWSRRLACSSRATPDAGDGRWTEPGSRPRLSRERVGDGFARGVETPRRGLPTRCWSAPVRPCWRCGGTTCGASSRVCGHARSPVRWPPHAWALATTWWSWPTERPWRPTSWLRGASTRGRRWRRGACSKTRREVQRTDQAGAALTVWYFAGIRA